MLPSREPESDPDSRSGTAPKRPSQGNAVTLIRRQRRVQADWAELQRFLNLLQSRLAHAEYSVCVVSNRGIRRYNRLFRSLDETTDVLSFPIGPGRTETREYLGDIVISAETARANARRYGVRVEEELKLLALHGVLHLLGHDHETDTGQMARRERQWAARLGLPQTLLGRVSGKGPIRSAKTGNRN
jgi:probable rRNA maturation factor